MNKLTLILPDSIRSKKNSKRIYARGKFKTVLPSKAYIAWEKAARNSVKIQLHANFYPLTFPLHVTVAAFYKGQQPDLSGVLESVGDALEGIVWENDKQIASWDESRLFHDLKNPHTIVVVETFNPREQR